MKSLALALAAGLCALGSLGYGLWCVLLTPHPEHALWVLVIGAGVCAFLKPLPE